MQKYDKMLNDLLKKIGPDHLRELEEAGESPFIMKSDLADILICSLELAPDRKLAKEFMKLSYEDQEDTINKAFIFDRYGW